MMTDPSSSVINLLPKTVAKAAEFYAARFGWRVFPLYEMTPGGVCSCSKGTECKTPGKHPRVSIPSGEAAVHPATVDVAVIKAWWKKWPTANIGVWLEGSDLLVLDIDKNDKKDGFAGLSEIMAYERVDAMPATLVCNTPSGGKHYYFHLVPGVPNKANSLGPGLDTWHSSHYVIVPPSNHVRGIYAWEPGCEKIGDYPDWLKPKVKDYGKVVGQGKTGAGRPKKERLDVGDPDEVARLEHALHFVDNTDRDRWVMVGFALARAFDWSDAGFAVYDAWAAAAHNYDKKKTAEQYYKQSKVQPPVGITTNSVFEWARQHPDYKGLERRDDRPFQIKERPENQRETLGEMAQLLPEFPIYQRGPKIVEIVSINQNLQTDDGWYPKGSYMLREVTSLQMATRIYPAKVRWLKLYKDGWAPGAINMMLCGALLGIGNWTSARKLRAFVQHPTIRDNGSLLTEIGYDEQSGLFVTEKIAVQVPNKPTKKNAEAALKVLQAPFAEFKWIDGNVSRAALMAALLTIGVRHLFDEGVPMFAIDAPRQGSGKTKLVKSLSNLWFGRPMAVTPYSSDQEEMKKHLAAMMLAGDRVVLFDNVHPMVRVNDPTLNALLTSGRMTFRELGSQRMLDMDTAATFFMTGNSLKIQGDMIRRTIKMHIDPEGLHPMNRKFKIDPLELYVLGKRPALISAALTIVRGFFEAGMPVMKGVRPLPSFEKWSLVVRNCLLWLGMDDVAESIAQGYEDDDASSEIDYLLRLLFSMSELFGEGLTTIQLLPIIDNNKTLKDAMLPFVGERYQNMNHPRMVKTVLDQVINIAIGGKVLHRHGPVWQVNDIEIRK